MRDADFAEQKARIQALADKWLPLLGLDPGWHITLEYTDAAKDGDDRGIAQAKVDWQYLQAVLTWYLPRVATQDGDELEECFIHECMHVLVNEMRWQDAAKDAVSLNLCHEERVCTTLARAIVRVSHAENRDSHGHLLRGAA